MRVKKEKKWGVITKKARLFNEILLAHGVWVGRVGRNEQEQPQALDRILEEFDDETRNLPCLRAGCGSRLPAGQGGAGAFPDADADVREVHGLPGFDVLPDVESFPHPAGGDACSRRRD